MPGIVLTDLPFQRTYAVSHVKASSLLTVYFAKIVFQLIASLENNGMIEEYS